MKKIMFLSINIVIAITLVMVMAYPVANVKGEAFTMWTEYVPMRDGILLHTKIFLPDINVWGDGPYPTLLTRGPYGIGEPDIYGDKNGNVPYPVKRGYAVVIQDTRGRWYSEGVDRLFYNDGKDGYDTVEWIASQPWSNGKVGQYGHSALGCTTYLTASESPPHLVAGYATVGSANLYNDFLFEGGAFRYAAAYQWGLGRVQHLSQSHLNTVVSESEKEDIIYHKSICNQILSDLASHESTNYPSRPTDSYWCMHLPLKGYSYSFSTLQPWWDEVLSHQSKDDFRDNMNLIDKIDVPMMHVGGWYDMFGISLIEAFTELQHKGNQKMIVGGGTHDNLGITNSYFYEWFDYWLKGDDTGIMDTPAVTYYCLGENEWQYADAWLTGDSTLFYFHENRVLDTEKCGSDEKPDSYVYNPADPVLTWGGRNLRLPAGAFDQTLVQHGRSDILTYKSATLNSDVKITGNVKAVLSVSSNCSDTDFTAKLMDVTSDGETILVLDGILRARYRQSMSNPQLMNEGTVYQTVIDLGDISYVFKQGHKIQVDISSSNFPKYDRNLNTGGCLYNETSFNVALNTVHHNSTYGSYITLPIRRTRAPDHLLIHVYPNSDAENTELETCVIDINDHPLSKAWIDRWVTNPEIRMKSYYEMGEAEIDVNNQKWPTGCEYHKYYDETCTRCVCAREFRKAIAYLTDKDGYISSILGGYGFVADTKLPWFFAPYMADLESLGLLYEYNVTKAVETLENAGFKDWDADNIIEWKHTGTGAQAGTTDPYGTPIGTIEELPALKFYIRVDEPLKREAGEMLAVDLQNIGIPVIPIVTERTVCYQNVMVLYDYHLYTSNWLYPDPEPGEILYNWHSSMYLGPDVGPSRNYEGFCNHEYDDWAEKVKYANTVWEAQNAAQECTRIFAKMCGGIPLWNRAAVEAYKTKWNDVVNMEGYGIDNKYSFLRMEHATDDVIDWGFKTDIETLNVICADQPHDWKVLNQIYDSLMGYNPFTLEFTEYWLAESRELGTWDNAGTDATEINFTLKPDVTFHDGTPVTPEDVKFTIDFMIACGSGVAWNIPLVEDVNSVDIIGDKIRVRMNSFSIWALEWIGKLPIIQKGIWENILDGMGRTWMDPGFDFMAVREYDPTVDDADENGIVDLKQDGAGPWIFNEYVLGSQISLYANTDYYLSQEYLSDRIAEMFHQIGDVDYDGCISIVDIGLILRAMGTTPAAGGAPGEWGAWNSDADLDEDGVVYTSDLLTAGKNFGRCVGC